MLTLWQLSLRTLKEFKMDEDLMFDVLDYADTLDVVEIDLDFGPGVNLEVPLEDL